MAVHNHGGSREELLECAEPGELSRRTLYGFLSLGFCDPAHEPFEELFQADLRSSVADAVELLRGDALRVAPVAEQERLHLDDAIVNWLRDDSWQSSRIREEHREVFGLTMSEDCPPHEVEYCEKTDLFYRSQLLADISGFYRAFGLRTNRQVPQRVDHLHLELEFEYFLWQKSLYGRARGHDEEDLDRVARARSTFFEEHLGWWVPAFGQAVEQHDSADFYGKIARLLRWFVTHERLRLSLPVFDERPEPNVPEPDPEGTCFECGIEDRMAGKGAPI